MIAANQFGERNRSASTPIHLWVVNVSEKYWKAGIFERLLNCVSAEKREKINRFLHIDDRRRCLIGDVLIRSWVQAKIGPENGNLVFTLNPYGKPLLSSLDLSFNISHSGCWVAAIFHRDPVGVDIERIAPIDYDIARTCFSADEYESFCRRREDEKLTCFYDLWTIKESYMKAVGMGMALLMRSFTVSIDNEGAIAVKGANVEREWHFRQYAIDGGYKLTACGRSEAFPDEVQIVSIEKLLRIMEST